MMVNSVSLDACAKQLRDTIGEKKPAMLKGNVPANALQLEVAAQILRDSEPSKITSISGTLAPGETITGDSQERPGFITPETQEDPEVLVFTVGILSTDTYRIDRQGKLVNAPA